MAEGKVNETRDFTVQHETDGKLDKSTELNESMSIVETSQDEYETTIKTIGGGR